MAARGRFDDEPEANLIELAMFDDDDNEDECIVLGLVPMGSGAAMLAVRSR